MSAFTGSVTFDGKDPIYRNHFPGRPVVPGSLITAAFIDLLEETGMATCAIKYARFLNFASPATYHYSISVDGKTAKWKLHSEEIIFAEGEFIVKTDGGINR